MKMTRMRKIVVTGMSVLVLGGTGVSAALASGTETSSGTEVESAADTAAQHADCLKVGIDDTVTPNVQYDDQTGACSLDTGTDSGGE